MTRKAHNVDKERTINSQFLDRRSYWTNTGHFYLFGADATLQRNEIRDLSAGLCAKCKKVTGVTGELDHIKGGLTDDRCWCRHNLQWLCNTCHRLKHNREPRMK